MVLFYSSYQRVIIVCFLIYNAYVIQYAAGNASTTLTRKKASKVAL